MRRPHGGSSVERSRNAPRARGPSRRPATASIAVDDHICHCDFQLWIVYEFRSSMHLMITPGTTLENPVTGERFTFTETAATTGGELLAFDFALRAGGRVPIPHVHPVQTERFEVVA